MSHTYVCCYMHCIFSTKERQEFLTPELRNRLWPYLGGIAREHEASALEIGGVADHTHILLSLPPTLAIARAMQLMKGGSSKWVHDTFPAYSQFAWQEGYAAFSVGHASLDNVREYIRRQEEHHRKHTFKEELIAFLERYGISFEEQYLL